MGMALKTAIGAARFCQFIQADRFVYSWAGALVFFKQMRFSPLAAFLGAVATMLNSTFFGVACWGIVGLEIAMGFNFFALALVMANTGETPWLIRWVRFALAGMCVGMNVMESADIGALASILVALFVFFKPFADEEGPLTGKLLRGTSRVAVVAVFAGFIALQTVCPWLAYRRQSRNRARH